MRAYKERDDDHLMCSNCGHPVATLDSKCSKCGAVFSTARHDAWTSPTKLMPDPNEWVQFNYRARDKAEMTEGYYNEPLKLWYDIYNEIYVKTEDVIEWREN